MKNAQNTQFATIETAYSKANSAYNARHNSESTTMQKDIAKGLSVFASFSEGQFLALEKMGIDWASIEKGIAQATNVKVAMRLPMFLAFIVSGNGAMLKGSAQTALIEYCALMLGAKTKDALRFASTGKGDENTSDEINIAKARLIQKAFSTVSVGSRDTQASVSFSKGGLLSVLGMVTPWAKGATMPGIIDCKLSRALSSLISTATDNTINLWATQAKPKAKNK